MTAVVSCFANKKYFRDRVRGLRGEHFKSSGRVVLLRSSILNGTPDGGSRIVDGRCSLFHLSLPTQEEVEQAASSLYNAASTILDAIYNASSQNDAA